MKVVYVAGPYRGDVAANIERAQAIAACLWRRGYAVICPHANTAHFDTLFPDIPDEAYLSGDMEILKRCDMVVLVPGWEYSKGTQAEAHRARTWRIPVFEWPDIPAGY